MLAEKLSLNDSELPTRPVNARPIAARPARFESMPTQRTHLMLVSAPKPTPRSLAWARRGGAPAFDASRLESMLRFERLNLG
jgi:hypothetical protein